MIEEDMKGSGDDLYFDITTIRENISKPALYEQMAEECAELTQALLKKARKLRNENYTPKSTEEIDSNLIEEFTDVYLCSKVLKLFPDKNVLVSKFRRWITRLERS